MLAFDKALIEQRKADLERARTELKTHFVGIDAIIDELISYIQVWYLMPELLKRPVIVNLWGMTGVGKTDLVRKLVRALAFQDRFAEIELSNIDQTYWQSSVSSVLDNHGFHDGKPSIVFFDEIQRFNTIDDEGKPMAQTKFIDFWGLLSDGQLARRDKEDSEIDNLLANYFLERKQRQKRRESGNEGAYDESSIFSPWQTLPLRKLLNIDMDMESFLDLSDEDLIELMLTAKRQKTIYEPINHAQTLILISGNLDEAFSMARQAAEADVDADIFHALTKKITLMDVKAALLRKFRPEQVARFGNIHVIYPSLRKQDFVELIAREIQRVQDDTFKRTGISLCVDPSLEALIYRNGVFPVQGVRPVFSSVTDILEVNLSGLLLEALTINAKLIELAYDESGQALVAKIGDALIRVPYVGRIDKIRASNEEAVVANISVHEAGHAVVYMLLFGIAPIQLQSRIASSYPGGFTFPHQIYHTQRSLLDMIKVYLSGGLAEELYFGSGQASIGRLQDREEATGLALDFIRRYGFDAHYQANYVLYDHVHQMAKDVTDKDVESLMARMVDETRHLLSEHLQLVHMLAQRLSDVGKLEAAAIAALAREYGLAVSVQEEGYLYIPPYALQKPNSFS
ncbi:AAA family ATPase [Thiolinea disciformis]|uniref:AAA family ATPase n=1 Tax=Thiolinea disciformis TaxID=125614 RepID=UPI000367C392|nr:AAA family ATPase [Thiolinea disciformis]